MTLVFGVGEVLFTDLIGSILYQVKKIHVQKRKNEIINRLNKTKIEKNPDYAQEKIEYERSKKERLKLVEKQKVFNMFRFVTDLLLMLYAH